MRPSQRQADELRQVIFTRNFTKHAEGSVLVEFGDTRVLCTASVLEGVPRFLKDKGQGWLTAEYGMLPRATHDRVQREAARGKQQGRTVEIQRLIGRSLRACIDLKKLGNHTIQIDCDVLQADGGTRTAAITGSCVALIDALQTMRESGKLKKDPLLHHIASISVGVVNNEPVLDLDYKEDSSAETDMNVIMTEAGEFIEVQGTAEGKPFSQEELNRMLELAKHGISQLIDMQKAALGIIETVV